MRVKRLHECVEELRHSRIKVSEKGKSLVVINSVNAVFRRGRIDSCLIKEGARADFFVTKVGAGTLIVELKGRDIGHALEQLFATVNSTECMNWIEAPIKLIIICAKYPSFDTFVARGQLRARRLGMDLKVICRSVEAEFERI